MVPSYERNMHKKVLLSRIAVLVSLTFLVPHVPAQKYPRSRFDAYPVRGKSTSPCAQVDLKSHPKARLFRTMLREGAKTGPNFAGHYTIVQWGCGSSCLMVAVVNCRNGRVYFAPFTLSHYMGQDFRIESRLFIVNPPETSGYQEGEHIPEWYEPSWHVWRRGRFVQLWPRGKRCGTCF